MLQESPNEAQGYICLKNFHCARVSEKLYAFGFVLNWRKNEIFSTEKKKTVFFCDTPGYYKEAYGLSRNLDSEVREKMRQRKTDKQ